MCHFITATLPENAPHEALDAVARRSGRQFQPLATPAVVAQIPTGSAYFVTTLAHCDCGTILGSARRSAARALDWATEEAKFLKKGWSRAKVARALEQRRGSDALKQEANEQAERVRPESLEAFVTGILASGLTPELGLLLHSYRGPLDEGFSILRREQVPAGAVLAKVLPAVEEDVLYVFRAGA